MLDAIEAHLGNRLNVLRSLETSRTALGVRRAGKTPSIACGSIFYARVTAVDAAVVAALAIETQIGFSDLKTIYQKDSNV